ncbi:uncharacterized protein LOC121530001 [Drosophila eugracilis]|uniref:uncharacterized protein LOC121530001 n=1 Tax=Drosophila eugracilis TaxID=29029 RepID=UPI001BDAB4DC|nr:uncharacterized protein LOC121530001 [Drosophila eugracilis]
MLPVLVVFQFISFTYSKAELREISPCGDMFKKADSNLTTIFHCLMENYNLTATLSGVLLKMDQVEVLLDGVPTDEQKYKPSPFENIDDILDIPADVSHKDCLTKHQIMQAILRKLEWYNLMNNRDNTLYSWPWKSGAYKPKIAYKKRDEDEISTTQPEIGVSDILHEIRCLLAKAIRNTGNKLSF